MKLYDTFYFINSEIQDDNLKIDKLLAHATFVEFTKFEVDRFISFGNNPQKQPDHLADVSS